jgi:hypothetical protein
VEQIGREKDQNQPMTKQRTGGMTAIGVLNIVFGGFGLLAALFSLLAAPTMVARISGYATSEQMSEMMLKIQGLGIFALAVSVVGLIAGIGIFWMKQWSRILSLVYAGLWILNGILSFAFPLQLSSTTGVMAARVFGLIIGMVYPIILFVLFNKPAWKTAFATEPLP